MNDKNDPWETLRQFFDNPETAKPDLKSLADALRGDEPLPDGFRDALAEILESRLPGALACNWTLKPEFTGRYDQERQTITFEEAIARAMARGAKVSKAMPDASEAVGISERTAWKIWPKIKAERERIAAAIRAARNPPKP
jgi:hypothetical protein